MDEAGNDGKYGSYRENIVEVGDDVICVVKHNI